MHKSQKGLSNEVTRLLKIKIIKKFKLMDINNVLKHK